MERPLRQHGAYRVPHLVYVPFPFDAEQRQFHATIVVDVSTTFEQKMQAIACYHSQFDKERLEKVRHFVGGYNIYTGAAAVSLTANSSPCRIRSGPATCTPWSWAARAFPPRCRFPDSRTCQWDEGTPPQPPLRFGEGVGGRGSETTTCGEFHENAAGRWPAPDADRRAFPVRPSGPTRRGEQEGGDTLLSNCAPIMRRRAR